MSTFQFSEPEELERICFKFILTEYIILLQLRKGTKWHSNLAVVNLQMSVIELTKAEDSRQRWLLIHLDRIISYALILQE